MAVEAGPIRDAQRILTRLRLDTPAVHFRIERGILILSGHLHFPDLMGTGQSDVNLELLHEMDRQLRQIGNIKGVEYQLRNYMHTSDRSWSKKRTWR